jgi:transposase
VPLFCRRKIRIVLEGLRGEDSFAELCRREATSDEVKQLRTEATFLKETPAELLMENRLPKKKA